MNPILVRNIKHLTDARYFAAMGVDWMSIGLNTDAGSFLLWHTLKDWVEGVKLAAEISADDEMLLAKTVIEAVPDGIIFNQFLLPDVPQHIEIFYETDSIDIVLFSHGGSILLDYDANLYMPEKLSQLPANKIFLQSSWTTVKLKALLDSGYAGGICFMGGEEDKLGMKDYGVIDDLLEILNR